MVKKNDNGAPQYDRIISFVFQQYWGGSVRERPLEEFEFDRTELIEAARKLGIKRPDNLGDVIYSYKFRRPLPAEVVATAPSGKAWLIEGAGRSRYRFRLVDGASVTILPREDLATIKIPDATPEIIATYALGDEQALLAKVRYNRLVDIFLGLTTYSLQNHLRTQVKGTGQIEIDEVYVGLNRHGAHYVIPVQAKGGSDKLSPVQTLQDVSCCTEKFPNLVCRPISAQFMADDVIALFELSAEDNHVRVVDEKHYKLVAGDAIDAEAKRRYAERS